MSCYILNLSIFELSLAPVKKSVRSFFQSSNHLTTLFPSLEGPNTRKGVYNRRDKIYSNMESTQSKGSDSGKTKKDSAGDEPLPPPSGVKRSSEYFNTVKLTRLEDRALFWLRVVSWVLYSLGSVIAVLTLGFPAYMLRFLHSHTVFRSYIRLIQQYYGISLVIMIQLFMPGSKIVLTGDYDLIQPHSKSVAMANHQLYPDWFYLVSVLCT
jgi:hypothetical protein